MPRPGYTALRSKGRMRPARHPRADRDRRPGHRRDRRPGQPAAAVGLVREPAQQPSLPAAAPGCFPSCGRCLYADIAAVSARATADQHGAKRGAHRASRTYSRAAARSSLVLSSACWSWLFFNRRLLGASAIAAAALTAAQRRRPCRSVAVAGAVTRRRSRCIRCGAPSPPRAVVPRSGGSTAGATDGRYRDDGRDRERRGTAAAGRPRPRCRRGRGVLGDRGGPHQPGSRRTSSGVAVQHDAAPSPSTPASTTMLEILPTDSCCSSSSSELLYAVRACLRSPRDRRRAAS